MNVLLPVDSLLSSATGCICGVNYLCRSLELFGCQSVVVSWIFLQARPAMLVDAYSRAQLIDLRPRALRPDDVTRQRVLSAGLARHRARPRGCRAGRRKQSARRSADQQLPTALSSPMPPELGSVRGTAAGRQRHVDLPPRQLRFATFNAHSVRQKVTGVQQMMSDNKIDVLGLTESWHEDTNDVPLRRLRAAGDFQVLECARPTSSTSDVNSLNYTNHGGIVIVAPTRVKVTKLLPKFQPSTYELLCARITSRGSSCIVAVIYRPGSEAKTELFFTEFTQLLEYMSSFASPFIITGDLNVRFDRPGDPATARVADLLSSFGSTQHVGAPTHDLGGTLDVVITGDDCQPTSLQVNDPGLSDHRLVQWLFNLRTSSEPVYEQRERRLWRNFDQASFCTALLSSCLCDAGTYTSQTDVNELAESYDVTIKNLLDIHAPTSKVTCRVRRRTDPWYDSDCRDAKRRTRKLERRYKRWRSDHARSVWIQALRSQHKLVDQRRNDYWRRKIADQENPKELWRAVDTALCRDRLGAINPARSATDFADFFESKVNKIREATDGAPPPTFTDVDVMQPPLQLFKPIGSDDVIKLVRAAPAKQSDLDPMPTWLLKDCIDLLAPYVSHLFNVSLSTGCVPDSFKRAHITPLLKKPGLDEDAMENYRPVSNLSILSKTLERSVCQQLGVHLDTARLLPQHQSAYRKGHSTETALAKVCSDLIRTMDTGHHALLALLDLSAAFDTVDHGILLERLSRSFAVRGDALDWLRNYLSDRRHTVRFGSTESSTRTALFGVPQGSVLGPLLFILYTADLGNIADEYGADSHFYADDSQLYISARPQDTTDAAQRLVACTEAIARWMVSNRLKLNSSKTDFMWCATHRRQHQLNRDSLTFGGATIQPSLTVRDLGVVLDSELSLSPHINQLVSRCFFQLRRIKSCVKALPTEVAKAVVNSFVVTRVDYCNALLAGAAVYKLDRLQMVLNTAARLIYGLGKYDHIQHVLRDRLHWLPMSQRVKFKLCLLTFKAIHGLAPRYIADLCRPVTGSRRSATRGDLVVPAHVTDFGERAFAVAAPKEWNKLPTSVRDSPSVSSFKARLKTYLFSA